MNQARSVAGDYDFHPLPFLGNRHVQTVLGFWLRRFLPPPPARSHVLPLPDGGAVVLHDTLPPRWQPGEGVAVLVHGLGGSHASPIVCSLALRLAAAGLRVVRLDLPGAGKALTLSRRGYNGGASADVRAALEEIHRRCPHSPLLLAGISLGGNIVLKLAGEAADQAIPGLSRVAALGPPIDLGRCAALLARPHNRFYEQRFVRELSTAARRRQQLFPDLPPLRLPARLSLRLFDELYTAPRGGFASADDYYHKCSAFSLIPCIAVPALILTARDDPFVAVEPFEELTAPPGVEVHIVPRGGHLGFLGRDGAGGIHWAEEAMARWLLADSPRPLGREARSSSPPPLGERGRG
jgi:predicted alpha/beta-fold hydrolase